MTDTVSTQNKSKKYSTTLEYNSEEARQGFSATSTLVARHDGRAGNA